MQLHINMIDWHYVQNLQRRKKKKLINSPTKKNKNKNQCGTL